MNPEPTAPSIAVIGVGNEVRSDDGVGWAIVARLRERARQTPLPPGVTLSTCDGEPARLLSLWEAADASIVIDAGRTSGPRRIGSVRRLVMDSAMPLPDPGATSSHGLGLAAAVELARVLGRLPRTLAVYVVEGGEFGLGLAQSAAVSAAVEPTARRVEREIRSLALLRSRAAPRH